MQIIRFIMYADVIASAYAILTNIATPSVPASTSLPLSLSSFANSACACADIRSCIGFTDAVLDALDKLAVLLIASISD